MNDYNHGRVIRMSFGGAMDPASERMLERVLTEMDGIDGFCVDPVERVLTAYVAPDTATELDLVRALLASGVYAEGLVGPALPGGGEIGAC